VICLRTNAAAAEKPAAWFAFRYSCTLKGALNQSVQRTHPAGAPLS
jgi:hypothetical protein